jgi:hypothetical protein
MKFTLSIGLILLTFTLSATTGSAQVEPRSQSSPQPTCVAVKPSDQSTTTSEQSVDQRSTQEQQRSQCALNTKPKLAPAEPRLSERDRLIKERFEQRIIPPQD